MGKALSNTLNCIGSEDPTKAWKRLKKLSRETHRAFHAKTSVKKKKQAVRDAEHPAEEEAGNPRRPAEGTVKCESKKAIIVVGSLTGNAFADRAFRNTAKEAVSDLEDRGYETSLLDQPTTAQVRAALTDPCVRAFVYVGHGTDEDSDDGQVGGRGGGDMIWVNEDEIVSSGDVRFWLNGNSLDLVILHACYQGAKNTSDRWKAAFGLNDDAFSSWSGACIYWAAYWWQFAWD